MMLQGEGADIIIRRLLTLVFDHLKPEKLQNVIFENKAVVDAHGVFIRPRVLFGARVFVYTQRGFLHCLFEITGFLRTSNDG